MMTTSAKNLLVELFVEELPPKALKSLGAAFATTLAASLKAQGLAPADAVVTPFASPRRLAAHVAGVLPRAADKPLQHKLMPVAVALDAEASGRAHHGRACRGAGSGSDPQGHAEIGRFR